MSPSRPLPGTRVNVVGAGPAGALTALLLARRGLRVTVYERREDPRIAASERGRSINLALAARGMRALETAGVMPDIAPLLVPMRGRCVHAPDGSTTFLPYGQAANEVIHSVSRATLTRALVAAAARAPNVDVHFGVSCRAVRPGGVAAVGSARRAGGGLVLRSATLGSEHEVPLAPTIAADGAGSAVRASLAGAGLISAREAMLDHDYKELEIPARNGSWALEREALHIWPRGGFMLIALPNADGSFTATLFLARSGNPGFAGLCDATHIRDFFAREFPDVSPLMPHLVEEFRSHPAGRLGTVYADRWHVGGELLLLGDAAHAIVPFHGQGMNCAFEDCIALDILLGNASSWEDVFAAFDAERRPNTDAIALMALENYVEMRDSVRDPKFLRQKSLALELERRFPGRFIPRYSMVMFHPEIPYAEALRRGVIQQEILDALEGAAAPDSAALRALVESRLSPLPS